MVGNQNHPLKHSVHEKTWNEINSGLRLSVLAELRQDDGIDYRTINVHPDTNYYIYAKTLKAQDDIVALAVEYLPLPYKKMRRPLIDNFYFAFRKLNLQHLTMLRVIGMNLEDCWTVSCPRRMGVI
jgi:hypothetical protein